MSLPPDVLDHTFSFLQSDPVTLKACAKTHPMLSQIVERHFYAHITLHDDNSVDERGLATAEFFKHLSDKSYIVNYVRTLEIKLKGVSLGVGTVNLDRISIILPMLQRLEEITLVGPCVWAVLPKSFRRVFLDCLHLHSMKGLCIELVHDFPLASLNDCNTIETLTLCHGGWAPDEMDALENVRCLALRSLTVQNCSEGLLRALVLWGQLRGLRTLKYDLCWSNFTLLSQLIEGCSSSLTSLNIDFGCSCAFHLR